MKKVLLSVLTVILLALVLTIGVAADGNTLLKKHVYRMVVGDTYEIELLSETSDVTYLSDSDAVSVDANGVVLAKKAGVANINVNGDTIKIHVIAEEIAPIYLSKKAVGVKGPDTLPVLAFLGDSITAGSSTNYKFYQFMSDKYHMRALNHGLSGSNIGGVGGSGQISFTDRVDGIPETANMVFVLGGVNDFGQNKGTFKRFETGLPILIEKLIDRFPDKQIVFSTPLKNGGYFSIGKNAHGNELYQFADKIMSVCAEYDIPVIDAHGSDFFRDFFLYDENGEYKRYTDHRNSTAIYNPVYYADGVHPNREGHSKMAEFFIEELYKLGVVNIEEFEFNWENKFTDVSEDDAIYSAVKYVGERGIMNGVSESEFSPDGSLKRGMFATILHRFAGLPKRGSLRFKDVLPTDYYSGAVAWASELGIVNGVGEYEFAPNNVLNKEQTAVMLYRFLKSEGYDVSLPDGLSATPSVDSNISDWAFDAVVYCEYNKILAFKDHVTDPKSPATRADIAIAIEALGNIKK